MIEGFTRRATLRTLCLFFMDLYLNAHDSLAGRFYLGSLIMVFTLMRQTWRHPVVLKLNPPV